MTKQMKLIFTLLLATVLIVLLSQDSVWAQKGRRSGKRPSKEKVIEKFDKDGDGMLSEAEKEAMKEAFMAQREKRRQKILGQYDTDGDGTLSEVEKEAAKEANNARREERRQKILGQYDTDGDGEISQEERAVIKEDMKKLREEIVTTYDADGDGKLSQEEREAAREAMGDKLPGFRRQPGQNRGRGNFPEGLGEDLDK